MWLKALFRHHRQGQTTEGCADGNGARVKKDEFTPTKARQRNSSPGF